MTKKILLDDINKIHTTPMGVDGIGKQLLNAAKRWKNTPISL